MTVQNIKVRLLSSGRVYNNPSSSRTANRGAFSEDMIDYIKDIAQVDSAIAIGIPRNRRTRQGAVSEYITDQTDSGADVDFGIDDDYFKSIGKI